MQRRRGQGGCLTGRYNTQSPENNTGKNRFPEHKKDLSPASIPGARHRSPKTERPRQPFRFQRVIALKVFVCSTIAVSVGSRSMLEAP